MHYLAKPLAVNAPSEDRVKECSEAEWEKARRRRVAASFLDAATTVENTALREALLRQAASLILPRRDRAREWALWKQEADCCPTAEGVSSVLPLRS